MNTDNISITDWEVRENSFSFKILSKNGEEVAFVNHMHSGIFTGTCRNNFQAICTAVNNTYGKGIDPASVPELVEALKKSGSLLDFVINSTPSGVIRNLLTEENILIKAALAKVQIK